MPGRIVLLVTSPRLPAGLLTAAAWDLVRVHPVYAQTENEQTRAVRQAGGELRIVAEPTAGVLIDAAAADGTVIWLAGPHGDQQLARELGLRLAAEPGLAEMELLYGSWDPPGARLLDAVAVMDRLHVDDPWKRAQTHQSVARYLLEEAYEAYDAIVNDDLDALRGEIGDVLLQVLLHARMAEELPEDERWTIDDVAGEFVAKMIRRNPHVFEPGRQTDDLDEIFANWNAAKRAEAQAAPKRRPSTLVQALTSLARSSRDEDGRAALRAALTGFDDQPPLA
jgi:XTP/dITP diphosphohydrolase